MNVVPAVYSGDECTKELCNQSTVLEELDVKASVPL